MYFHSEDVALPKLDFSVVEKWVEFTIQEENKIAGEISFIFCSDQYLLDINKKYLSHDYFTDIITFDYSEDEIISGDIFISVDRVGENATEFNISLEKEFLRICIHGILHLIGFKDKSPADKQKMTNKENEYLLKYEQIVNS